MGGCRRRQPQASADRLRSAVAAGPTWWPALLVTKLTAANPVSSQLAVPTLVKSSGITEVPAATPADLRSRVTLSCAAVHGPTLASGLRPAPGDCVTLPPVPGLGAPA